MATTLQTQTAGAPESIEIRQLATTIAATTTARNADAVDRDARFPIETLTALREARMLSALVPSAFGGSGASIVDVSAAVETIARECASTAMVYAMHHIQVATLARHGRSPWAHEYLRAIAAHQLLMASATTELGIGGDVRSSICALQYEGDQFSLEKNSPVVSYGAHADAIFATARRAKDSPANDQVLVVIPTTSTTLEHQTPWNALGFRGTCSDGYIVRGTGSVEQIISDPYGDISARTMLPTSHVLWAAVWLGIATTAVDTARKFVRAQARKQPGSLPPGAIHLAGLVGTLEELRALVGERTAEYDRHIDDAEHCASMGFALRMNALKVSASTLVVECVTAALRICGIAGYVEGTPYSLGRLLRDAHGAALMVSNDRLIGASAQMLLVHKEV